ncbi:MAG: hypothetical protein ABIA37_01420 [Candidatus Woesearchaeota archaeon]
MFRFIRWRKFYKSIMGAELGLSAYQLKAVLNLIKIKKITTKEELLRELWRQAKTSGWQGSGKALEDSKVYLDILKVIKEKITNHENP